MPAQPASAAAPVPSEARPRFFRPGAPGGAQRTTWLELYFDLVFVFAITQLSHLLVDDLTWSGAGQATVLLFAAWWAWNYTTWMTNWFDPDTTAVRLVLMAAMLAALLMSIAIPEAFGDRAALFAGGYVGLQVVRNAFATAVSPPGTSWRDNFGRILFAERFQLFVIIALGESIVVTGATAAGLEMDAARVAGIAVAFALSGALWWLYFNTVARRIGGDLDAADDRGRLARNAFTYAHIPIVAGIIVSAVGEELLIAHPGDGLSAAGLLALCGGPALYLVGHILLRFSVTRQISHDRTWATIALLPCGLLGIVLPALATGALVVAVLVGLIVVEARHRRPLTHDPRSV